MKRVIIIVMDSAGIGELPDAAEYGDKGCNTLGNIALKFPNLRLPNLISMGLGNIDNIKGFEKQDNVTSSYGRMAEMSKGKDTTIGHWEIAGLIVEKPFPVYPYGFPNEIIERFTKETNIDIIGNIPASGTEIIQKYGLEHMKTGKPIVYTSADSVFQIAAHEEVINIERLYKLCRIAREILTGEHAVARVIARPFLGEPGKFIRTENRRDFSVSPFGKTMLDYIKENGFEVKAVGKIEDIFNKCGITESVHTHDNMDGVNQTIEYMKQNFSGIIFTNLVDFDMKYGHRNDVEGYAKALTEFDSRIPEIQGCMNDEDILIITADHGCDPTTPGTDHTREYVPLLIYGKNIKSGINLGTRKSFADIAATVVDYLQIDSKIAGESFLRECENKFN